MAPDPFSHMSQFVTPSNNSTQHVIKILGRTHFPDKLSARALKYNCTRSTHARVVVYIHTRALDLARGVDIDLQHGGPVRTREL